MIFRQLFDKDSSTYTYLLADETSREAILIDPVLARVDRYLQLLGELELKLAKVIDTHVHADHITGMGALRDRTHCVTAMGNESAVDVVSLRFSDGDRVGVSGIDLIAMHTPGHTRDSYCLLLPDRIFTGDSLLIRGTGRTDFQQGSNSDAYHSLFNKILKIPEATMVYPGHDYKGDTVSTIGEERAHNPRLQVESAEEYAQIMDNLGLANPKMMDVAVPANMKMGLSQDELEEQGLSVSCDEARRWFEKDKALFVDVRDTSEGEAHGVIADSMHMPYGQLDSSLEPEGALARLARESQKTLVIYCAYGERSAMTVQLAQQHGVHNMLNLKGGLDAWRSIGAPLKVHTGLKP